ncbi:hypothetical protein N9137_00770 [Pseudomonadales bacterium]|nr:hypothetical protein [Pseudomonadales bacterium]
MFNDAKKGDKVFLIKRGQWMTETISHITGRAIIVRHTDSFRKNDGYPMGLSENSVGVMIRPFNSEYKAMREFVRSVNNGE